MTAETNNQPKPKVKEPQKPPLVVETVTPEYGSYAVGRATARAGASPTPPNQMRLGPATSVFSSIVMRQMASGAPLEMPGHETARGLRETAVLQMQRQFGNKQTQHALIKSLPKNNPHLPLPIVQRFISSEHRSLGNVTGEVIPAGGLFEGSPELTYGEVVALSGDFYRSYENMASPNFILADGGEDRSPDSRERKIAELNELKNLFRIEGDLISAHRAAALQTGTNPDGYYPEGIDTGYITDPASGVEVPGYELATGGRYSALALENFLHFSFGDENINAWKEGHRQALKEAFLAGFRNDTSAYIRAMARNAASNHYLTDAFSSGHMRVPRRCADQYYRQLMMNTVDGLVEALVNALPERIDFTIPLSAVEDYLPDWVPDLPDLPDIEIDIPLPLQEWAREAATPLANELRPVMNEPVGMLLGGLVSKWLHDKENERGLYVFNAAGGKWQAFGDVFLDKPGEGSSSETNTTNRAEAEKAVLADVKEVQKMFVAGQASATPQSQTGEIPSAIYFAFDSPRSEGDISVIDDSSRGGLDALATYIQGVEGVRIGLTGWADSRGSVEYNTGLADRRISAVRTYLISQGVSPEKLGAEQPAGEPLVPTTDSNHHQFRRVDIALEGTPIPANGDQHNQELPANVTLPPEIEGRYAAEDYLPQIASNNPPLEPYEWCDITDQGLKNQVSGMARDMIGGVLTGKATQFIYAHLDNYGPYQIEIPVPLLDPIRVTLPQIPIRRWAIDVVNPVLESAVNHVLTDSVFTGLMDGACTFAEAVPEVESGQQCGGG